MTLTCVCRCYRVDQPENVEYATFNHWGHSQILEGVSVSEALTFLTSRTSEDRTSESLLSSGDSNRKSNTRSMTSSFSGGVRRSNSSNSAVWFGDSRWRASSCTQHGREKIYQNRNAKKGWIYYLNFGFIQTLVGIQDLPLRTLDWACKSLWLTQIWRITQSCSATSPYCDWLRTHTGGLKNKFNFIRGCTSQDKTRKSKHAAKVCRLPTRAVAIP